MSSPLIKHGSSFELLLSTYKAFKGGHDVCGEALTQRVEDYLKLWPPFKKDAPYHLLRSQLEEAYVHLRIEFPH